MACARSGHLNVVMIKLFTNRLMLKARMMVIFNSPCQRIKGDDGKGERGRQQKNYKIADILSTFSGERFGSGQTP